MKDNMVSDVRNQFSYLRKKENSQEEFQLDGESILADAREVLEIERATLSRIIDDLGDGFIKAVKILYECRGRVVVVGMGKSGLVGRKMSATFSSTGTPSIFLHPAEAIHGDLGMVCQDDVIVAISNSGNTREIVELLPWIKRIGGKIISITGGLTSELAKASDVVIPVIVEKEACPLGLAPTASTTAVMALGDALAVSLLKLKKFKAVDFARLHPGGSLGRKFIRVKDLMHSRQELPVVSENEPFRSALTVMSEKKFGVLLVADENDRLKGIFTDGDLRRLLEKVDNPSVLRAGDFMKREPVTVSPDTMAEEALSIMEKKSITSLPVLDEKEVLTGLIHLHDLLKARLY